MRSLLLLSLCCTIPLAAACQLLSAFSSTAADSADGPAVDAAPLDSADDRGLDTAVDSAVDSGPAPGTEIWARRLGHGGQVLTAVLATENTGDLLLTGRFVGEVDLGGGPLVSAGVDDILLAKLSATGQHIWSKRFGGEGFDQGLDLAVDGSGNIAITGFFQHSVDFGGGALTAPVLSTFVASFDSDGDHRWSKAFGEGSADLGASVAVDAGGNVAVTGGFFGTADLGGDPLTATGAGSDIFVASFDRDGGHRWSQRFGATDFDVGLGVANDAGGNVFVTGFFNNTMDFGGNPLSATGADIFVASFTTDGVHRWSNGFGGAGADSGRDIATDGSGHVYFTGTFTSAVNFGGDTISGSGSQDVFLAKLEGNGNHVWSTGFASAKDDSASSVIVAPDATVTLTGLFRGSVDFGGPFLTGVGSSDSFVASFSLNGGHRWSRAFGAAAADRGDSVAVDAGGNVFVSGFINGIVDFGGGAMTAPARGSVFLASFDSQDSGSHRWSQTLPSSDGWDQVLAAAIDPASGTVFVTGEISGTVDLGGGDLTSSGDRDVLVAGFQADGTHLWSKVFGDVDRDGGRGIAVGASGDVVVTGVFRGTVDFGDGGLNSNGDDIFVASFAADDGAFRWAHSFGSIFKCEGHDVATDGDGNSFVTGFVTGAVDFGGGSRSGGSGANVFAASFASDGAHRWSEVYGGNGFDTGYGVAVNTHGVVFTGKFAGTTDFDGTLLTSTGASDIFVLALDGQGGRRWAKGFGGDKNDEGRGIAADPVRGHIYVTGFFQDTVVFGGGALASDGNSDVFLVALDDDDGAHVWSQRLGGDAYDIAESVAVDLAGRVFVTGAFRGTASFGGGAFTASDVFTDVFVASFTADGAHRWSHAHGGVGFDGGHVVSAAADRLLVGGYFNDRIAFGGAALPGAGAGFVAALVP